MIKPFRCLNCKCKSIKVACRVYEKNGMLKGKICEWCASVPPKYKQGIRSEGWSCEQGKPSEEGL